MLLWHGTLNHHPSLEGLVVGMHAQCLGVMSSLKNSFHPLQTETRRGTGEAADGAGGAPGLRVPPR